MKKRLTAALLLSAALGLSACGSGEAPAQNTQGGAQENASEQVQTETAAEPDERTGEEAAPAALEEPAKSEEASGKAGPILEKYTWYDSEDNSDELPENDYKDYKCYGNISIDSYAVFNSEGYEALDKALLAEYEERKKNTQHFRDSITEGLAYEDEANFPWPYEDETTVYRSDDKVVSYLSSCYLYLGGAHGGTTVTGCNFDTKTGKTLEFSEVVKDPDALCEAVKEKLAPRSDELFEEWEDTVYRDIHENSAENGAFAWVLNKNSIEVIFGDYEVAPFAAGHIHVVISDDEYPGIINEKYVDKAGLLSRHLTPFENISLDLDGDGKEEFLRVETIEDYNEEYGYNEDVRAKAVVVKDGEEYYSDEVEDLDFGNAYVMQNDDGLYFMYIEMQSDNDWHVVYVLDLNDPEKGIKNIGQNETGAFYDFDPVDPNNLVIETRISTMGTRSAYRICHVDVDGMLVPYDDEYIVMTYDSSRIYPEEDYNEYRYLHVAKDFTAYTDKEKTKMTKVAAKTELLPLRTDDDTYMVFSDETGKEVYVFYDEEKPEDEWERFIDGMRESEVFEDVMYAG